MASHPSSRLLPLLLAAALASACGPGRTEVRKAVAASGHRTLAVLPFDYRGGERNAAPQAYDSFERRLREDGFRVYDRGKTRNVYQASLDARTGAFDAVPRAAELGKALGVSAVVLGACDGAYDRVERHPAEYRWDPVLKRRVVVSPAQSRRLAGVSVRVRIIESGSGRLLWQTGYAAQLEGFGLGQVTDQAVDVVHEQLEEALLKGAL